MTTNQPAYAFAPDEQPPFIGAPYAPRHPLGRRVVYALMGVLLGVTAALGNALVIANVNNIAGNLGLYVSEANLMTAVYYAMYAGANLVLIKARAQFGIPLVVRTVLVAYSCAALLTFFLPGFATELLLRAVSGVTAGALVALSTYYLLQVFPPALRPAGTVIGFGVFQLGVPVARLFPVEMLAEHSWRRLDLMEVLVPLVLLAATTAFPIPPPKRQRVFERLDFLSIALLVPSLILVCLVINEGRLLWWTDTPWLGEALAGAILLLAAVVIVERLRTRPLLHFEWITTIDILRFAAIALLVRLALAEQTFGSVGLLTAGGLTNDQLHSLFELVCLGMVLGTGVSVLMLYERKIPYVIVVSALVIAMAALMDSYSNSETRPEQLYFSQTLIAFGTSLFIGPALLSGIVQAVRKGGDDYAVSMFVVFGVTQNLGGIGGAALLGSLETIYTNIHAQDLLGHARASDPLVVERIGSGVAAVSPMITDPIVRTAEGTGLLLQSLQQQAAVAAANNVFRVVFLLALATACYATYVAFMNARAARSTVRESP